MAQQGHAHAAHHHHHHGGGGGGGGPRLLAGPNLDAFGAIISADRMPKGEINVETRAAIIAAVQAGEKKKSIARRFGISNASINRTLDRFEKTGQLTSRPRAGRPRTKPAPSRPTEPSAATRRAPRPSLNLNLPRVIVGPPTHPNPATPATFLSPQQDRCLARLLATLTVTLHPTTYVYCSFADPSRLPPLPQIQLFFQEPGGITIVTSMSYARAHNLPYLSPCKMLTLAVTSDLSALGFMPVIEARLAAAGMCANTVSGFFRDHLFVPVGKEHEAVRILTALAEEKRCEANIVPGQFPPVPQYTAPPSAGPVGSETPSGHHEASETPQPMSEPIVVDESADDATPAPAHGDVDADEAAAESQVLAETRAAAATLALEEQEAARSPSLGAGSPADEDTRDGPDSSHEQIESLEA
ncbi:ACT domain-containing protein [Purpureocillium lavendulum]|uniref:ACT domain-containing protein n=1 Tax=Purpureocillium lavendulum TaxID=1247861 RepID=A0AB34FQK0_9HYPO|nr:ACT domain-containing protein [Purpureocillium lavendulum]